MKKLILFFLVFALCFCTFFNAHSISIDGYDKGAEWNGADAQIVLNGESNCKVNFGLVKWIVDAEINTVYFCIMFKEPDLPLDNVNVGVSLQIENSEPFAVSVKTTPNQFDIEKYYFDGAVTVDHNGGATCEIRLGLKFGLPDTINGKIKFYDSEGSPSNVYDFSIKNTNAATKDYGDYGDDDIYNEKHTSPSSDKTTAKSSNNKSTSKSSEKTSAKNNNSKETNKNFGLLDFLFAEATTVKALPNTTKSQITAAEKTTRKNKTKNKSNAESKSKTEKTDTTTSTETSNTETTIVADTTLTEQPEIKTSAAKLDAYKIITIVAGGISLVAISVLGTIKAKKDNNNENDRNS